MKQKIEWYKEVLELEPGSRVFFPLARLLADDGQLPEAVAALYQGLLRHPDHVEARLLLVDFLHRIGDNAQLQHEVENVSRLLEAYPAFWNAWSDLLRQTPSMHDAALALRFFASALQGKTVTWASIIEHGLSSILNTETPVSVVAQETMPEPSPVSLPQFVEDHAIVTSHASEPVQELSEEVYASDDGEDDDAEENVFDETDADEVFSIRTRSMAEVLAEQGDYSGAADIYRELIEQAAPAERPAMEKRMEELQAKPASVPATSSADADKSVHRGQSSRLADLLESLAQRLESRAR